MPDFLVIRLNSANNLYEVVSGPNPNGTFTGIDGTDANGLAALQSKRDGKYVSFPVLGSPSAKLQTNLGVTNADLLYTAVTPGSGGNSIRVRYVVAGVNTVLSVSVATNDITVNLATDAGGVATSTASAVRTAVAGSAPASALVTAALASGNSGAGIPIALAFTNLAGGNVGAAVATTTSVVQQASSVLTSF